MPKWELWNSVWTSKDRGILLDVVVATSLVEMHTKCGSIRKAGELFDNVPQTNLVSLNVMIVGYEQNTFIDIDLQTK